MTVSRLLARPLLASMFVVGGAGSLKDPPARCRPPSPSSTRWCRPSRRPSPQVQIPTDPTTLVRINGAAQLLAGLALATGRAPRTSAAVLAATLLPTTAAGHRFWEETDKGTRSAQQIHFFKNVSMLGGLMLAAVDTEGKPGVAWRARRAAKDVKREASGSATRWPGREARLGRQVDRLDLSVTRAQPDRAHAGLDRGHAISSAIAPPYAAKATGSEATVASAPKRPWPPA
jgi:uncharacterized membrane protein YphA (DoxX/SURF4 family)